MGAPFPPSASRVQRPLPGQKAKKIVSEKIEEGSVVGLHYSLTGSDGEVIDASGDEVFHYLHGAENIVPGLEKARGGFPTR